VRLTLDEHFSVRIAEELRNRGHDVDCVKERPELESLSDRELLSVMTVERRALLTENVRDFAPLIRARTQAGESHYGVIYSSSASMPRSRNTIGEFVRRLDRVLVERPGDDQSVNMVMWL
jgi:Domain of unknown function (DUF5615)